MKSGLWYLAFGLGVAASLGGCLCAAIAYGRTFRLHGKTPLFPRLAGAATLVRHWLARLLPFLRKDGTGEALSGEAQGAASIATSAEGYAMIPVDAPPEQQIPMLIQAVDTLHESLARERETRRTTDDDLSRRLFEISERLSQSVSELDAKIYDVGVDSLRLQILGIVLVIIGTLLLAVTSLWS